jgi:glycine/D-amino acid oxidase-like deaminating enzyme
MSEPTSVLILGGGIVGASTAYYLRNISENLRIVIVDKVGVAAGASGKAGE